MSRLVTIQRSPYADNLAEDGDEMTRRPYPFHIKEDGSIADQDFWKGTVSHLIGFQKKLDVQKIDLFWTEFLADPQQAVGMYAVISDDRGTWSVYENAIESVREWEGT